MLINELESTPPLIQNAMGMSERNRILTESIKSVLAPTTASWKERVESVEIIGCQYFCGVFLSENKLIS